MAALAAPASARRLGRVPQIELLRFEGRVGAPRPDDKGTTDLQLGHGKKEYRFQLKELRVLSGGRLPGSVLAEVSPYRPNFFLRGADAMVQRLAEAGAEDSVTIMGYRRAGSRDLMVTEVEVTPPAKPTTVPTAAP